MPSRASAVSGYGAIFTDDLGVAVQPLEELRERFSVHIGKKENRRVPFMPWNERIPLSETGERLDFDLYPFQVELYSDPIVYAREVVECKPTQIGMSEKAVRWATFFADTRGYRMMYVFPGLRQLRDFSDDRMRGLIRGSDYLASRVPRANVDNKLLKQVGIGYLYMRGSRKKEDLDSVPLDGVVLDEYDDLTPENIPHALKRLSAVNSAKLIRRIGVPSYSDFGIHEQYETRSDKRRWLVKCDTPGCQKELPVEFYPEDDHSVHYMDTERCFIVCGNCEEQVTRRQIAEGRWVAEMPDREIPGYHMNRLIVPGMDYKEIIDESLLTKPAEVKVFWTKTLGRPYDSEEDRLSKEAIAAATRDYRIGGWDAGYSGDGLVTMGVDVASVRDLNVRISLHETEFRKRALYIGPVTSFDRLVTMMDAFRVKCAVIDGNPDGRLARAFAERFAGRAFVVSWGDKQKDMLALDEPMRRVSVRRTETIGATLDMVRKQLNLLPENIPPDYVRHMRSALPFKEEDDKGRVVVGYRKQGPDDYLQAEAYDLVATELWWALYLRDDAKRDVLQPLDAMMEFRRSHVSEYGNQDYSPGIASDEETWSREMQEMEAAESGAADEFGGPYY